MALNVADAGNAPVATREIDVEKMVEDSQAFMLENFPDYAPWKYFHHFAPDVYIREIFMEAGNYIIGARHKTEHFNIVLTGRAKVMMGDEWSWIVAPCIFVSKPGVKKVLSIHEDMRWLTVHANPDNVTDFEKLEEILTEEPPTKVRSQASDMKKLREYAARLDQHRFGEMQ